jgi:hypothetical protein
MLISSLTDNGLLDSGKEEEDENEGSIVMYRSPLLTPKINGVHIENAVYEV